MLVPTPSGLMDNDGAQTVMPAIYSMRRGGQVRRDESAPGGRKMTAGQVTLRRSCHGCVVSGCVLSTRLGGGGSVYDDAGVQ
jgi:hypothetical protein